MSLKPTPSTTIPPGDGVPTVTEAAPTLADAVPRLRIRIGGRKLGPGKADLLEAIGRTGSLAVSASAMGMSARRAWLLVDELNRMFTRPAVTVAGEGDDAAALTEFGRELVTAYRRLEARTRAAMLEELAAFESDLAPGEPST